MRAVRAVLVVLAMATFFSACTAAYNAFPSTDPRSPQEKQALAFQKCGRDHTYRWDLGTGRLEDIAHKVPKFYSYRSGVGSYANEKRVFLLRQAELPEGITLVDRPGNGHQLVEFAGLESPPGQVVAFSGQREGQPAVALYLSPATCPHIVVEDTCANKKVTTVVTNEGPLPCFEGRSGEIDLNFANRSTITPGEVIWFSGTTAKDIPITLTNGPDTLYEGTVQVDSFPDATPATVLMLVDAADDSRAFRAFQNMAAQWRTPEFEQQLGTARATRVQKQLESSVDLLQVIRSLHLDPEFPGTAEIQDLLEPEVIAGFREVALAPPTGLGFWRAIVLLDKATDVSKLDLEGFLKNYGAAISERGLAGPEDAVATVENEFMRRWPTTPWGQRIRRVREAEAAEARATAEEARAEEEKERQREAVAERSRCAARCNHTCMADRYANKALCRAGCVNYECDQNFCVGACQVDCSLANKAGRPGCVSACRTGRCGQ